MLSEVEDEGEEESYDAEANAFLSAVAAEVVFPGGVLASLMNRRLETVRDVLLYAIGSEKDSLLFYMEMLLKTRTRAISARSRASSRRRRSTFPTYSSSWRPRHSRTGIAAPA